MLKKTLIRACVGFLIGIVIGNVIALLTGTSATNGVTFASMQLLNMAGGSAAVSMMLQSLFSGLYGAACFAGMSFYKAERLPLAAATALHCATIILLFVPISLILGWVSNTTELLIVMGIQFIVFFIIWLIMWSIYKKQVKELNEMQEHFQHKNTNQKMKEGNINENK